MPGGSILVALVAWVAAAVEPAPAFVVKTLDTGDFDVGLKAALVEAKAANPVSRSTSTSTIH